MNAVCLVVHATLAYLTLSSCNGIRFGVRVNPNCTADGMTVSVWRFATQWPQSNGSAVGIDELTLTLKRNESPIRFDFLSASFFGLSALFHALALVLGSLQATKWLYWDCLDDCFCWWRCGSRASTVS
jgi:hypothetical protein